MEAHRLVPASLLSGTRHGAIITVKGADGRDYRGRIIAVEGEKAEIRIFEELPFGSESPLDIVLVQAVPKRERMEMIIQKATELGVSAVFPCRSERSTTEGSGAQDKSHRWPAIAQRAVEQCRRRVVPFVAPCRDFREIIGGMAGGEGTKLILYEKERTVRLKDVFSCPPGGRPNRVVIACGSEGGFTEEEISAARENGFMPVSLGGRVMRCETACLAALSIIQHEWGDL